jgi:hypothetical protein
MDGPRFDRWTRMLASAPSRRGLLKGVIGAVAAGLLGAEAEDAEAARSCQRCGKNGQCTPLKNGTSCGDCGVCAGGACVANPSGCESCKVCNTSTFHCDPRPDATACGECGSCQGGRCRAQKDKCSHCASCTATRDRTYICKSRCTHGDRCCPDPDNHCVAADACCNDADCPECQSCVDDACKPNPDNEGKDCGGSSCSVCKNGQCVAKADNFECPGGLCCGGACRAGAACCDDDGCPECGTCVNFACERTAKNGTTCGNTPSCHVCADGECVSRADGFACIGVNGTCCGGFCCVGNQSCCSGSCCDGTCILGFCCPTTSFAAATIDEAAVAAGAEVCCPFGPPCGDGAAARCCPETELCCGGTCCPPGYYCCNDQCQINDCTCPPAQRPCPDNTCCIPSDFCTDEGCCNPSESKPCCGNEFATPLHCEGPCCTADERCCADAETVDGWCCPTGVDCTLDSCCPSNMPRSFNCGGLGIYCCPEGDHVLCPDDCTQDFVSGRRG